MSGTNIHSQYEQLAVTGAASIDGTLAVALTNSFLPKLGDFFDILDWGTLNDTFSTLQLPALGNNLAWDSSQLYTTGVISVTTVPEPASGGTVRDGGAGVTCAASMCRRNSLNSKRTH